METLRRLRPYLIIGLFALLPFIHLAYTVVCYEPHTDGGFWVQCAVVLFALIELALLIFHAALKEKGPALAAAVALLVCAWVFYMAGRIPFCPECDHVTKEELGILSHWIGD